MTYNTDSVRVRAARGEDAEIVAALFHAINSLDGPPPVMMTADAVRRDLLGANPWATLLVGLIGGTVVGFITGNAVYDSMRGAGSVLLNDLYVLPEARRRGVGRALVAGLAAAAMRRGAESLWWGVDDGDTEAALFYRAIGATPEEHFTGHLLRGDAFAHLAAEGGE